MQLQSAAQAEAPTPVTSDYQRHASRLEHSAILDRLEGVVQVISLKNIRRGMWMVGNEYFGKPKKIKTQKTYNSWYSQGMVWDALEVRQGDPAIGYRQNDKYHGLN